MALSDGPTLSDSEITDELLRRIEKLIEMLGTHGNRCERCDRHHATIQRALRYHMARYWVIPSAQQEDEMAFIESLRLALPPGTSVTVRASEAVKIIEERDDE